MYRIVWCVAAALLAFSTAMPPAAADDRDTCGSHRPGIDEAIATCDRLIRQNPKDAQAYFGRALEYNAKGDDDRAIADYGDAIRLKPKVSGYYEGRGDVYSHKGEYDRAIADYGEAIRLEPKFARFYVDRARVYMSRRDYDRAIADYDEAIKIDAKWPHSDVYDGRGGAYEAKGDLDRAIADFDQALKYDPANAEARRHRERVTAALARQTPAKPQTLADVRAGILAQLARPQSSPADATADDRGTCTSSFTRGKEEEGIAACSRLIERDPNDAVAYLRRGSAYDRKGDGGRAGADFERAIELNPKDPIGYFGRGTVNARRGQGDRAIADFDQAIRLDPRYAEAYEGRGSVLTSLRQYDRAIADLDEAIRLDPKAPHAYSSRGLAYQERGDLERAIADYDEALRIDPADSRASFNRNRAQAALASRPAPAKPQVTVSQPAASSAVAERRVALVIGNSRYASAPALPNPRRDAEAVAKVLRDDGFQTVMLVSDIGRDALREALRKFRAEADKADWGLVYYAGHGIQIGKTNYLIPVDAKLTDERDVQGETIPYGEVEAAVGGATALRIIILDACRNDPFEAQMARANSSRSLARGLSPPPEPDAGLLVVYSAKDGQVAEDGDGANSPFATALVAQLKVPRREVRRVFDYVREEVMNATGRRQQPFTYGSLPGSKDYYFVAGKQD